MKTTLQYLDEIKRAAGVESDYAVAKLLRITNSAVSRWRLHNITFDTKVACKVARILNVDPLEVIAAAQYERSKDDDSRAFWREEWIRAGGQSRAELESLAGWKVGHSAYQDADCPRSGPLFDGAAQHWHP
jgi:transcriptional regulator with XRE-family HTH domain